MPASFATLETAMVGGVVEEPMMISALDLVTNRRALVVAVGGIAAVVEHDDLQRHAAELLRHEFQRVALGNAERRARAGRGGGDADGDFASLGQGEAEAGRASVAAAMAAVR